MLEPLVAEPDKLTVVAEDEAELLLEEILAQERSYKGVVLSGLPEVIPKDGLGVASSVSSIVYQKMLTLPNLGHPTSSQYVLALAMDGTPRFSVFPLTGHPVSVIQTSLPPTAAWVTARASSKRADPSVISLLIVFWKYGYASIPIQSQASITGWLVLFTQAVQVSTWPTGAPLKPVPEMRLRTWVMQSTIASGSAPTVDPAAIPVGEFLYRSSLPQEMAITKSVKDEPYCLIAASIAVNSLAMDPEAQIPSRSWVPSAMAAGMADVTSLSVPAC